LLKTGVYFSKVNSYDLADTGIQMKRENSDGSEKEAHYLQRGVSAPSEGNGDSQRQDAVRRAE